MGFYYRKSINIGPFRVNVGKSGSLQSIAKDLTITNPYGRTTVDMLDTNDSTFLPNVTLETVTHSDGDYGRISGLAVGQNATYNLSAKNNGPQSASGTITVSDTLPTGLSYVSASGTGSSHKENCSTRFSKRRSIRTIRAC